jgi:8-hydroxy-5-deazaflavin:NADPH oxidoreductase
MKLSIIGHGAVGSHLATLFANAGHDVAVGVRETTDLSSTYQIITIGEAIAHSNLVILAIPYGAVEAFAQQFGASLEGKILVDATNPLQADYSPLLIGEGVSAAQIIAGLLPNTKIVKAFNTVFADVMAKDKLVRGSHVLTNFIASDHKDASARVAELSLSGGFGVIETGPLALAKHMEALTHLNIAIAFGTGAGTDAGFIYVQNKAA